MTVQDFYEEMKEALRFFGLSFGDKDKVTIAAEDDVIIFKHENREIRIRVVE